MANHLAKSANAWIWLGCLFENFFVFSRNFHNYHIGTDACFLRYSVCIRACIIWVAFCETWYYAVSLLLSLSTHSYSFLAVHIRFFLMRSPVDCIPCEYWDRTQKKKKSFFWWVWTVLLSSLSSEDSTGSRLLLSHVCKSKQLYKTFAFDFTISS